MEGSTMILNGVGTSLDVTRKHLKSRLRHWLGQSPRNSGKQYLIAVGMETRICQGDFVSLNEKGELVSLTEGLPFIGAVSGVGLSPQGHATATTKIGRLWEHISGLVPSTEKGAIVYADAKTQQLSLGRGIPIGLLAAIETFGGDLIGHIQLEVGTPGKPINTDLHERKMSR